MTFHRYGLELGPFELFGLTFNPTFHFYGLIIVLGIFAAAALVSRLARRAGQNPEHVWNGLIWIVALGVIFARLWHVLFPSISSVEAGRTAHWYLTHPFDLNDGPLIIWNGGLSIFGAVIGGALGVLIYARRQRLPVYPWLDLAAIAVPLGQAIGRWGNYVNEELYGEPTTLPWGLKISNPPPIYGPEVRFHPLFLYESLWNALTVIVLVSVWLRWRERLKNGDFVLFYLIAYGTARFFLEFLRLEVTTAGGVNVSQVVSAGAALIGLALLLWRHRAALLARKRPR